MQLYRDSLATIRMGPRCDKRIPVPLPVPLRNQKVEEGEESKESELSQRIKKYLEENQLTNHCIVDDMERMTQSLRTTYPKYNRRDLASFKTQVVGDHCQVTLKLFNKRPDN